ncbi:hypothetical protein, partial [Pseudomonas syringae]
PTDSRLRAGTPKRERGAEWWGKSLLVTFGLFSKVTRCKSGTNPSRYRKNGYTPNPNLLGCHPQAQHPNNIR